LEVRDQLLRLVRLQEVSREIRAANDLVHAAPHRMEEIENRFRERNAEYVAVQQRFDALESDQRTRGVELATLEESRKKYMDDLMGVQNQREYAAMLKEIDGVKSRIAEHEDAILKDMEEIESVKEELTTHADHISAERELVKKECAEVEAASEDARQVITRLETERHLVESELPRNLVATVRRLEAGRQGRFLSKAEDGICQSCFVRVRPQGFQEVKLALKIHFCGNCKRLLYHEPSLSRLAAAQAEGGGGDSGEPNPDQVEAVDGGAV
jgi:predicted  nucleic acid-binding Zn-ribbon protein